MFTPPGGAPRDSRDKKVHGAAADPSQKDAQSKAAAPSLVKHLKKQWRIEIPHRDTCTRQSAALHLAIGLFVGDEATLAQASIIAGMPQTLFLMELGKRRIPIHYGAEELAEDLNAVAPGKRLAHFPIAVLQMRA
jgi:predicted HTH domain antitoxin